MKELIKCKHCDGTGGVSNVKKWIIGDYCKYCGGTGWVEIGDDRRVQQTL